MPPTAHGPFSTAEQAAHAADALRRTLDAVDQAGTLTAAVRRARAEIRTRHVTGALAAAGVALGDYDLAVAAQLAAAPLETIAVVLDWLTQAAAAGNVELLAEAAEFIAPCPAPAAIGGRCEHGDWATCRRTELAWLLRGLDPVEARAHALARREP